MAKLCGRPGCSEPGAASYGMIAEDLLFWVAPLDPYAGEEVGVLCRRHADAMRVPRGWTLDDRREPVPRLFRPPPPAPSPPAKPRRRRPAVEAAEVDQLPLEVDAGPDAEPESEVSTDVAAGWSPVFDVDDDLGGLLEVTSPLLARAFRGADRPRR